MDPLSVSFQVLGLIHHHRESRGTLRRNTCLLLIQQVQYHRAACCNFLFPHCRAFRCNIQYFSHCGSSPTVPSVRPVVLGAPPRSGDGSRFASGAVSSVLTVVAPPPASDFLILAAGCSTCCVEVIAEFLKIVESVFVAPGSWVIFFHGNFFILGVFR